MLRVLWPSSLALLLAGCAGATPPPDGPAKAATNEPPPAATSTPAKTEAPSKEAAAPAQEPVGKLEPAEIQKVIWTNFAKLRACYEEGLRKDPSLQGRIAIRFVIDREGKVRQASEGAPAFPDPAVTKCVVDAFNTLEFPRPEGGIVTVEYPVIFPPGSGDCKTTKEEKDGIRTVSLTCAKQSMKVTDMPVKAVDEKFADALLTGFEQQSPKKRRTRTKPTIADKTCWVTSVDGVTWSSMLLVTEAAPDRALVVSCLDESQGGTSATCQTMVENLIKSTVAKTAPAPTPTPDPKPKRPLPTGTLTGGGF